MCHALDSNARAPLEACAWRVFCWAHPWSVFMNRLLQEDDGSDTGSLEKRPLPGAGKKDKEQPQECKQQ